MIADGTMMLLSQKERLNSPSESILEFKAKLPILEKPVLHTIAIKPKKVEFRSQTPVTLKSARQRPS
jgi:hypothetical protein